MLKSSINISVALLFLLVGSHVVAVEVEEVEVVSKTALRDIQVRLTRLEQIIDNQAVLEMFDALEMMQQSIQALNGQLEQQAHQIEQLMRKQRDLYVDLDERLSRLENGKANTSQIGQRIESQKIVEQRAPELQALTPPPSEPDLELPQQTQTEIRNQYQLAFNLLQDGDYVKAKDKFIAFLKSYPDNSYAGNAQYWLAEIYYVTQDYQRAINSYQALFVDYPKSQKIATALLKVADSYLELGNTREAKKNLNYLINQYPKSNEAKLAKIKMQDINGLEQ